MVVALGALDGDAIEGLEGVDRHVVPVEVPSDLPVGLGLGHLNVTDQIPWTRSQEPQRLETIPRSRKEDVACHLLLNEPPVRLVPVETADDIIPVRPCVRAELVFVLPVRLTVVDDIEPVTGPSLSIPRGSKQPIHHMFIGLRVAVTDEPLDVVGAGREPMQIEMKPSDEGTSVRFRRRSQPVGPELVDNETVDRVRRLRQTRHPRHLGNGQGPQGPPVRFAGGSFEVMASSPGIPPRTVSVASRQQSHRSAVTGTFRGEVGGLICS